MLNVTCLDLSHFSTYFIQGKVFSKGVIECIMYVLNSLKRACNIAHFEKNSRICYSKLTRDIQIKNLKVQ
jgi:hypothetical protein